MDKGKFTYICPHCKEKQTQVFSDEHIWARYTYDFEKVEYLKEGKDEDRRNRWELLGTDTIVLVCSNCEEDLTGDVEREVREHI